MSIKARDVYSYEEEIYITGSYGGYAKFICDRPNLKQAVIEMNNNLKQVPYGSFRKINKRERLSKCDKEIMEVQRKIDQLVKENEQADKRIPLEETYIGLIERQMPSLKCKFDSLGVAVKLMGKSQTNSALDTRRQHQRLLENIQSCNYKISNYKTRIDNFKRRTDKNNGLIKEYEGQLIYLQTKRKNIEDEVE